MLISEEKLIFPHNLLFFWFQCERNSTLATKMPDKKPRLKEIF